MFKNVVFRICLTNVKLLPPPLHLCVYIHIYVIDTYVIKMVHGDYTVLTLKWLGGDSLQVLAAYLLSSLFGIPIPAKYKVTESMT